MVHDLNNVIGAMVAFGTLAQMQLPESSSTRSHVDQILEGCRQVADLVRQLSTHNRGVGEASAPTTPSVPINQGSMATTTDLASNFPPTPPFPVPSRLLRILCVDDEPSLARVYSRALKRFGYEVVMAGSGSEALEVFAADPDRFDAVITDWGLPGMDGRMLSEALHQLRPELPILLVTGDLGSHEASVGLPRPWRGVLAKPFTIKELQNAITVTLGGAKENV
jgi:CheY-like chemotaxis protein